MKNFLKSFITVFWTMTGGLLFLSGGTFALAQDEVPEIVSQTGWLLAPDPPSPGVKGDGGSSTLAYSYTPPWSTSVDADYITSAV